MLAVPMDSLCTHWNVLQHDTQTLTTAQSELARLLPDEDAGFTSRSALMLRAVSRANVEFADRTVDLFVDAGRSMHGQLASFLPDFEQLVAEKSEEQLVAQVVNKVGNIASPAMLSKLQAFRKLIDEATMSKWPRSAVLPSKNEALSEVQATVVADIKRIKTYMGVATCAACLFCTIPSLPPGQNGDAMKAEVKAKLHKMD